MVRFLHTADWQLGMTRRFLDARDALPRFQQARIDAIRAIGDAARDHEAQFVVVAGDVFETNQPDPRTVERACEALRSIDVPVYLLPGNHDPLDGASVFRSPAFRAAVPDHVVVLEDDEPRPVPGVAAEVVGAPWRSKAPTRDLAAEAVESLLPVAADQVRVLVAHGAVDAGVAPDREARATVHAAPLQAALEDGRIDYVALGDRHSTWQVPGHDRLWYAGAPEPTRFDEVDPGNVLLVEVEPGGAPAVTPVRVGTWRFLEITEELRDAESVERLDQQLADVADRSRTIVRCKLSGVVSLATRARLEEVLDAHAHAFACLELPERHTSLLTEPDDADLEALDLSGYARDALDELREDDSPVAAEALAQLYRIVRERDAVA
ncbi:MAG: exonuclease SbcCD subunit D [Trueperaceae bacterium]|nr:exonuclease SbcCD subunit D [Trueperaceae bacterium]